MNASSRAVLDLEWLLNYEMRASARYRRCVSLALLTSPEADVERIGQALAGVRRECDKSFYLNGVAAVVMGETAGDGAARAVARYQAAVEGCLDLRFGLATYPGDGNAAAELIEAARRRLEAAKGLYAGAVVAQ